MQRFIFMVLVMISSLYAENFCSSNLSLDKSDDDAKYEGISGTKYKYDLSDPIDRMNYSLDLDAQMNDKLNAPINPGVELDRSLGQYGGGIQNDD